LKYCVGPEVYNLPETFNFERVMVLTMADKNIMTMCSFVGRYQHFRELAASASQWKVFCPEDEGCRSL
jgi:hypothetical protein